MNENDEKAYMLLMSLILHYHGLDEEETVILKKEATLLNAHQALEWANAFISEDYISAFERSREFLYKIFTKKEKEERVSALLNVWNKNYAKGYVTEMETTGILTLSKDWKISSEFMEKIKNKKTK